MIELFSVWKNKTDKSLNPIRILRTMSVSRDSYICEYTHNGKQFELESKKILKDYSVIERKKDA